MRISDWISAGCSSELSLPPTYRAGVVACTEIGMRDQGHARLDAKQLEPIRHRQCRFGNLFGAGFVLDMGIDEEEHALVVEHRRHRRRRADTGVEPEHIDDMMQLALVAANSAAQHGIDFATLGHQRSEEHTYETK